MREYKRTPIGNIPTDWHLRSIEDFGDIITGSTPPTKDPDNFGGEYLFVTPSDLDGSKYIQKTSRGLSSKGFQKCRRLTARAVAFVCIGSSIGKVGIVIKECVTNQQINAVVPKDGNVGEYLFYFLQNRAEAIAHLAGKQAIPIINKSHFANIPMAIPDPEEQKEISNLLNNWDRAIDLTERLITAKQELRKSLMQQLLRGKKRLPPFTAEWPRIMLQDYLSQISERNRGGKINRVLSVTNDRGFVLPEERFSRSISSADISNYKIVRRGQFAYNPSRINVGSWALLNNFDIGAISPMYVVFGVNEGLSPRYLEYWLQSHEGCCRIDAACQGSVRHTVSFESLSSIKISLPPMEEQNRIVHVLELVDKELDLLRRNLSALQEQKKGLMQQLLTGKKRVKIPSGNEVK